LVGIGRRWLVKGIMGEASTDDILELAARVYEGLSPRDIDEIEEMPSGTFLPMSRPDGAARR
jgi:hypothetical protein